MAWNEKQRNTKMQPKPKKRHKCNDRSGYDSEDENDIEYDDDEKWKQHRKIS